MLSLKNWKKYLTGGVFALSLFHFINHIYALALPPLFPLLKAEFGVGNTQVGMITSVISFTMVMFQLPLGMSSDRIGRKRILFACLTFMIVATLLTSWSTAFWMILAFQVMLGFGVSGYHPVGISAVADLAPPGKSGKFMSLQAIGGSLGVGIAPLLMGGLASIYGWRIPLRIIGLAGLPLLLYMGYSMQEPQEQDEEDGAQVEAEKLIVVGIALFYMFRAFAFKSLGTFLPTYLVEVRDFSLAWGGFTTSLLLITGAFAQPLGGILADRFNRTNIVVISACSAAFFLFLVNTIPLVRTLLFLVLVLLGFSLYISMPAILSLVKEVTPSKGYGKAFGINFTTMAISGTVAPVVVGMIADSYSLSTAFEILPILLVLAGLSILMIRHRV